MVDRWPCGTEDTKHTADGSQVVGICRYTYESSGAPKPLPFVAGRTRRPKIVDPFTVVPYYGGRSTASEVQIGFRVNYRSRASASQRVHTHTHTYVRVNPYMTYASVRVEVTIEIIAVVFYRIDSTRYTHRRETILGDCIRIIITARFVYRLRRKFTEYENE